MMSRASNRRLAGGLQAASFGVVTLLASVASAVAFDVRWDDPFFGGYGVSEATATSASSAGIPIIQLQPNSVELNELDMNHQLDPSSVRIPTPVGSAPATATSNWTATNDTGSNTGGGPFENLYLIFAQPIENTITLDGQSHTFSYDPSDVGLSLRFGEGGLDWVILKVLDAGTPAYYPAVSLGTLADGAFAQFPLNYTLENPQVFTEAFNFELGIPQWNLYSASIPSEIPEPSALLLVLAGLGAIAVARRARP